MIRANRVAGDRAAPDRGNDGDMGTVIDLAQALQLELACQVTPDGKANVRVRGELDIATADQAYTYLRDVVDSQDGPVLMNLSELSFCDAAGLRAHQRGVPAAGGAARAGPGGRARAALRPLAQADRGPARAAPDHAHHRDGRGVPRGPHPVVGYDRLAAPGRADHHRLTAQPVP